MRMRFATVALAAFLESACGGTQKQSSAPTRSPSLDYPPPAQETSQGEVVGADRVPPGDKLKTGARIGPEGVSPAERPASTETAPATKPKR